MILAFTNDECSKVFHPAVQYAVTRGSDFAFFLVNLSASFLAVPSGICEIWL